VATSGGFWVAIGGVLPHVILLPNASRMMLPAALILGMLDSILSMLTKAQSDADGVRSSASD
jgi:hypothetical protein